MSDKPSCENIGFVHAWAHPRWDSQPIDAWDAATMQRHPAPRIQNVRYCQNCGKRQVLTEPQAVEDTPGRFVAVAEWRDA